MLTKDKEEIFGNLYLYDDHFVLEKEASVFNKVLVGEKEKDYDLVNFPDKRRLLYIKQLSELFEEYKDFYVKTSTNKLKKELGLLFGSQKTSNDCENEVSLI